MNSKEKESRNRKSVLRLAVFLALALGMGLLGAADNAQAQTTGDIAALAAENAQLIMVVTIVAGGAAIFIKGLGTKRRTALGVVALAGIALIGLTFSQPVVQGAPPGPGGTGVRWVVLSDTTYPAAADVDTEMLDSQGATACDAGTPDLNGELPVWATSAFVDENSKEFRFMSDSDDDASRSSVGFQEIDCPTANLNINLAEGKDLNGDGTLDAITYSARLISMSPATFNDGNLTTSNVLFFDPDFGWECAWFTEGGEWVNAFGDARFQQPTQPSSGPWTALGSHNGPSSASEDIVLACVFDTTNGSPAGYTVPGGVGTVVWRATIAVGSPEDAHIYTLSWILQTRT